VSTPLGRAIVEVAATHLGVKETSRNRGPMIDEWITRMGLDPAGEHPWCMAFAWCCLDDACKLMGAVNPLRPSAKVIRLWQRAEQLGLASHRPVIGGIACHVVDPADPRSAGHCGVTTDITGDHIIAIEGNTNEAGSREGTMVRQQSRRLGWVNLGWIVVPG